MKKHIRAASVPILTVDERKTMKIHYEERADNLVKNLANDVANGRSFTRELTNMTRQQFQELSIDIHEEFNRRKNNTEHGEVPFLPPRDDLHPNRNQARRKIATLTKGSFDDLRNDVLYELKRRNEDLIGFDSAQLVLSPSSPSYDTDFPSPELPQSPINFFDTVPLSPMVMTDSRLLNLTLHIYEATPIHKHLFSTPIANSHLVAKAHYDQMAAYLGDCIPTDWTVSARERLTHLTMQQFTDLSTDVYDEIIRRTNNMENEEDVPFLPIRDELHPERNQARQKLATLTQTRFKELTSDVLYELSRRYPQLNGPYSAALSSSAPSSASADDGRQLPVPSKYVPSPAPSISSHRTRSMPSLYPSRSAGNSPGSMGRLTEAGDARRRSADSCVTTECASGLQSQEIVRDRLRPSSSLTLKSYQPPDDTADPHNMDPILQEKQFCGSLDLYFRGLDFQNLLDDDIHAISDQVANILSDREHKRAFFLSCSDNPVPTLNLLQTLLDRGDLSPSQRSTLMRALTRLAKLTACYPDSIILSGIRRTCMDPVAGGGFADIWKGHLNSNCVAMKALRIYNRSVREKALKEFCHEAIIWRQLKHPNILPFHGVFKGDHNFDRLCLISPWMDAGNVMDYLRNNPNSHRLSLLADVLSGLSYLHYFEPPIIHGDLKGANIFVTPFHTACLGDFGLSRFRDSHESTFGTTTGHTTGTLRWQAPELFDCLDDGRTTHPSAESDVYSFGCVCLELMTGKPPFSEISRDGAVVKAIMNKQTPQRPSEDLQDLGLDDNLWLLMTECWDYDPSRRPGVGTLLTFFDRRARRATTPLGVTTDSDKAYPRVEDITVMSSTDVNQSSASPGSGSNPILPPLIFDNTLLNVWDGSEVVDGDAFPSWAELKEYLESQSKSIVHAIQIVISAISGVRTRTLKPTPMLNENLTQIVAIVSSIVAVCKDSLGSAQQGRDVLRELSDHAHQLSKLRDEAVLTRESRKVMARSSFAIANAMKKLMTLQCFAY